MKYEYRSTSEFLDYASQLSLARLYDLVVRLDRDSFPEKHQIVTDLIESRERERYSKSSPRDVKQDLDVFGWVLVGILMMAWGADLYFGGPYYSPRFQRIIDFSGHTSFWGAVIFFWGALCLVVTLIGTLSARDKKSRDKPNKAL